MDIVEKARQHFPLETTGQPFQTHELQRIKVVREMADEIERLRSDLAIYSEMIEQLRETLNNLDKGINQWLPTESMIKKSLLKLIDDALKEGE